MGGASTQIAFEPSPEHQGDARNLVDVRLRLLGGEEIKHSVFVTTWLGYGTNQARERYVGKAISDYEEARREGKAADDDIVLDPCLPKGLALTESPVHATITGSAHVNQPHKLAGTGSFEGCMRETAPLLNKNAPCPDAPCLMNGVHVPPINFAASHFIGVSEYWYSSDHIFGLGGAYDFVQYERAASDYCGRDWEGLLKMHEDMKEKHRLGGSAEAPEGGKIGKADVWDPKVERSRLQMQCFKAAWMVNVLHEGLGLPRIVDPGGNVSGGGEDVINKAEKKGLGRPAFQSLDTIGDIAITWTLGKMVLEASKEVPPMSKATKPIVDPIDDILNTEKSPFQPIRPPFLTLQGLEDRLSPHLPQSLTRSSLGFSPVLFVLVISILCLVIITHPIRRHLRISCLRYSRKASTKRDDIRLEEGIGMNGRGTSQPPSPTSTGWSNTLHRVLGGTKLLPSVSTSNLERSLARVSSTRSFTTPIVATTSTQYSRASSPIHVPDGAGDFGYLMNNASTLLSARSTDGSSLSPRPAAMSRSNSMLQISNKAPHQDD